MGLPGAADDVEALLAEQIERMIRELGWRVAVTQLTGPFFSGEGRRDH